ncbi:unnamed protein product [Adineta steineri]|uniref:RING-type domain-containing protein n=1 Tax=Adineta steineri TaxID=433720 RepID=A0A818K671_9BILA|nr:unnamed protein product [Adineta steineri]CAF3556346.1 unnamed protein product [Adineta steineri]
MDFDFPGYIKCSQCQTVVAQNDKHDHILHCRPKSITQSMKKCLICQEDVEDLILHCENCRPNEETNNSGYATPRAQTPVEQNNGRKKHCTLCNKDIDESIYIEHISNCSTDKMSIDDNQSKLLTNNSSFQRNQNNNSRESNKKQTKLCLLCSKQIDESIYKEHIESCSDNQQDSVLNENDYTNHNETFQQTQNSFDNNKTSTKIFPRTEQNQTKHCILCDKDINELDYKEHVLSCGSDENSSISKIEEYNSPKKQCIFCSKYINQSELSDHIESCSNNQRPISIKIDDNNNIPTKRHSSQIASTSTIPKSKQKKDYSQSFDDEQSQDHNRTYSRQPLAKQYSYNQQKFEKTSRKDCIICFKSIDELEYMDHVSNCTSDDSDIDHNQINNSNYSTKNDIGITNNNNNNNNNIKKKKDCIICFKSIDECEYTDHVLNCLPDTPNKNDNQPIKSSYFSKENKNQMETSACANVKTRKDCIICFKPIDASEYMDHVQACLGDTDHQPSTSSYRINSKCFTCNRFKKDENDLFCEIACHSHHNHCLLCLKQSMEEFVRNRQVPVCHKSKCDYELSRHDISSIPLERRLSDRLFKLVKGQQRPFCSKCHFYINIDENENFDEHFELCEDLIPCEYCHLPYPFEQLESHTQQCRNEKISRQEKLTNFILTKTKYPFTKEQIRFYIQLQIKNNQQSSLDPFKIIQALAEYGATFPFDMPRRDCDICMEACPYDNIYVFDCADSHKLCYTCYYQSCQTKMNNGEILTCAICTHPLKDGELNQLRIPFEELQKIRDYQMKKTFEVYSSRTRGIIKCPKQNCTWVAEAADPNERFRVTCLLCNNEFCSLCNQQYHYRTTCQQLPGITQRWFFWCQTERARYLTMRAQQDATYGAQLDEYNRRHTENENRNRDLRRRYDELMNDEQYKAQNCRLCPSCKRVVQRLEGCDSMICGQDAHGGNVQSGCGTKFNWAQAQQYTPSTTAQPKHKIVDLPKPDIPVVHHNGIKCDQCQNDVNGIRFDCIHCPSLTFCEKCEEQATLNHSRENQDKKQQQHVFRLIMKPEEEATLF